MGTPEDKPPKPPAVCFFFKCWCVVLWELRKGRPGRGGGGLVPRWVGGRKDVTQEKVMLLASTVQSIHHLNTHTVMLPSSPRPCVRAVPGPFLFFLQLFKEPQRPQGLLLHTGAPSGFVNEPRRVVGVSTHTPALPYACMHTPRMLRPNKTCINCCQTKGNRERTRRSARGAPASPGPRPSPARAARACLSLVCVYVCERAVP